MADKCTGGGRTLIEVVQPGDCTTCVGIKRFVNNGNGTITVVLTNGQSFTYTSVGTAGATGPKGDTGDTGVVMFHNKYPASQTAGLTGLFEVLDTTELPANALAAAGDQCIIRAMVQCGDAVFAPNVSLNQEAQFTLNGVKIGVLNSAFADVQVNRIEFIYRITRIDKNNATVDGTLLLYTSAFGFVVFLASFSDLGTISGVDFSIAQTINMEAKTDVGELVKVAGIHLYGEYKKLNS